MKIKSVTLNNRRKTVEIVVQKRCLGLPFSRLRLKPTAKDKICEIYVDPELGHQGITYKLTSGAEDSIPLDAFLDYNKDPDYLKKIHLHKLTLEAHRAMKKSGLSKQEIIRRLGTSPSQLYRLLDHTNHKKSIDEMVRLLTVLGCKVEWNILEPAA